MPVEDKQLFDYLRQAPKGIVLENLPDNAYMKSGVYSIFNDKPLLLGWPSHLNTWHGDVPYVWSLTSEIRAFYQGRKNDTLAWLQAHNVDYVVIGTDDKNVNFNKIEQQLEQQFFWFGFNGRGQKPVGVWVRKTVLQ